MTVKNVLKLAAIIPLAVCMTSCGRKKVDINKYLELDFSGFDTVGIASYKLDIEKMVKDNPKAFDLDDSSSNKAIARTVEELEEYFIGELDESTGLSNGDTVTFEWDIDDEDLEEDYPIKLSHEDKKIEVEKLHKAEEIDPFEYITVSYEGISPNGAMKITNSYDEKIKGMYFNADKTTGLSNGDTVKITVDIGYNSVDDFCMDTGRIPKCTEKEYTVEGLSGYAQKLDDIPADSLKKIDSYTQDGLRAKAASGWKEPDSLKTITLLGNYMIYPKDSISTNTQNYLYSVYKIDVENSKGSSSFYYYSYVENVILLEDGTCSFDLNAMKTPYSFGESFGCDVDGLNYSGYKDLDSLFNKHVTTKIDKYEYESTVKQ